MRAVFHQFNSHIFGGAFFQPTSSEVRDVVNDHVNLGLLQGVFPVQPDFLGNEAADGVALSDDCTVHLQDGDDTKGSCCAEEETKLKELVKGVSILQYTNCWNRNVVVVKPEFTKF